MTVIMTLVFIIIFLILSQPCHLSDDYNEEFDYSSSITTLSDYRVHHILHWLSQFLKT